MVGDEVTFIDTPLCETFNLILAHFEEEPPEPKIETVEIPFGSDLDITDSMGEVAFHNRVQTFEFLAFCGHAEFRKLTNEIMGLVHGVKATYQMTLDPEYTYEGRWQVTEYDYSDRKFGKITMQVDTSPWKLKKEFEYTFNAYPAVTKYFESGRRAVRPTVTSQVSVYVTFKGLRETFPAGTHTSSNLLFTWGTNEATFEAGDWVCYQSGHSLVINDKFLSYFWSLVYPSDTTWPSSTLYPGNDKILGIEIDDDIVIGTEGTDLWLDDSRQYVTVRYSWWDL